MSWRVPLFELELGPEELEAVERVIKSRWLSAGPETEAFEEEFSKFLGGPKVLMVSSGTAAIHMALRALGVEPGDEVIVPAMTFVSTATPVLWLGAKPVFADSESLRNPNISARTVEPLITPKTKVIIFVHYAGFSDGVLELAELARERGIALVEDAAHTHGSLVGERKPGTIGDIGCFSFYSNKNMTTGGEGGAVVTWREGLYRRLKLLRSHGMTRSSRDAYSGRALGYDVVELGYNYRPTELQAAFGRAQLRKLAQMNTRRLERVKLYRRLLSEIEGLILPFEDPERSANYIFPTVLPEGVDRASVMERMAQKGVQTSVHYPPIHKFSYFRELFPDLVLPVAEEFGRRELTLPLWPSISEEQVRFVVQCLAEVLS